MEISAGPLNLEFSGMWLAPRVAISGLVSIMSGLGAKAEQLEAAVASG